MTAPARRTSGTKTSLIRSARRWIGAFEPWARWTSSTMRARAVSRPTRVARITNEPVVFRVAPMTSSRGTLRHGDGLAGEHRLIDRRGPLDDPPVDRDAVARPDAEEVAGLDPLECHLLVPPGSTSSADVAWSPTSRRIAPVARPFARASSHRPSRTRPMTRPRCRSTSRRRDRRRGRCSARASRPRCSPRPRSCRSRRACPCSSPRGGRPATRRGRTGRRPTTG